VTKNAGTDSGCQSALIPRQSGMQDVAVADLRGVHDVGAALRRSSMRSGIGSNHQPAAQPAEVRGVLMSAVLAREPFDQPVDAQYWP